MERLFRHPARLTAYRATPGTPGGFIANNAQFFNLPNATIIEADTLRIQAKIVKSIDPEPNAGKITITNLTEQSRANFTTRPLRLKLEAGFDDNPRHIITGDLRYGYSELKETDWETVDEIADGDQAWRYAHVSKTYKAGTTIATVLKDAAASMGFIIDAKTLASPGLQAQFAAGRALDGPMRAELTRLLAPFGYGWSIQNGQIQILRDDETRPDAARVISEDTGMVGSPEYSSPAKNGKPPHLKVKCRLYPELTPGARINVQSISVNGMFRIEKLTHTLDTHGDDWDTEIEAKPNP